MRIGIDYFPAATHAPGVGRYARELTRALSALDVEDELRLIELGRAPRVMSEASLGLRSTDLRRRIPLPARLWPLAARLGLGADRLLGGVDVFHQVRLHGPPVSRAAQTYAVSEWPSPCGEDPFLERLAHFDALFVFCNAYRERVLERTGFDSRRVHLVPVGADHWLRDLGRTPETIEKSGPPRVLVLGAAFPERRHLDILRACEMLQRGGRELHLTFAGSQAIGASELRPHVEASSLSGRVLWCDPAEGEMPALVAESSLLVHLCHDPGTAVTPLEALLLGVPVLVSPVPAFEEVLGRSAHYLADSSIDALAAAIDDSIEGQPSPEERDSLLGRYSWRHNALASLEAWRGLH